MRNPTFLHVSAAPACPAAATFLVPPTLGAAERGVKRTTLVSSAPVATPYLAGLYRALVIGNDDYEDAELVTPV